jgi:hypothetical protein
VILSTTDRDWFDLGRGEVAGIILREVKRSRSARQAISRRPVSSDAAEAVILFDELRYHRPSRSNTITCSNGLPFASMPLTFAVKDFLSLDTS